MSSSSLKVSGNTMSFWVSIFMDVAAGTVEVEAEAEVVVEAGGGEEWNVVKELSGKGKLSFARGPRNLIAASS